MKDYKFLFKPLFFVMNLVFATWLVLVIEKVKPSDFGPHKRFFEPAPKPRIVSAEDKSYLRSIAIGFKYGQIDSLGLEQKLDQFLASPDEDAGTDGKVITAR